MWKSSFTINEYIDLIKALKTKGYKFINLDRLPIRKKKLQVLLTHDVDVDVEYAGAIASIDLDLEIFSNFFVMVSSPLYNLFSKACYEALSKIKLYGHSINLHFDPSAYGLKTVSSSHISREREFDIINSLGNYNIKWWNFHRIANTGFKGFARPGIIYPRKDIKYDHFSGFKYFADSHGAWRFGHPLDSKEFSNGENLHILTHPFWWGGDIGSIRTLQVVMGDVRKKQQQYVAEHILNI